MGDRIKAPFTEDQIKNLNAYQHLGIVHEYTCGNKHGGDRVLVAYLDGWHCPTCEYRQDWAHDFSANVKEIVIAWNESNIGQVHPITMPKL